jgi:hypothetical protein
MADIKITQYVKEYPCELCGSHLNSETYLFSDSALVETWCYWDMKGEGRDFVDLEGIKIILEALGHTVRVEEEYEYITN